MNASRDESYWREHLAAIEREGMTTKEYAKREGIAVGSLYQWRKRLKQRAQRAALVAEPRPRFAAVQVVGEERRQQACGDLPCTLVVGRALRLEMAGLPDPCWLAATASALSSGSR